MKKMKKQARRICKLSAAFLTLAAFLCCISPARTVSAADKAERWTRAPRSTFVGVVKNACQSVVSIQGEKQYEASGRRGSHGDVQYDVFNGMGTGVVIDERGYILTNYHVVKGLLKLEVITADGEHYRDVELIRNDVSTDLAILKIEPKTPLRKLAFGRSSGVELAEDVFAIGNPYGYHCSITRGIVSSLDRPLEVNDQLSYDCVIQTDAAVNPGNSGGPLINIDGEMIGLNAAVREDAENIAFAIPIDVVAEVCDRMLRQTVAKMTHHGLKFRIVSADEPEYPEDGDGHDCLIVDSVDTKSPAAAAGVQAGDVLISSNGYETRSALDFTCSLIGLGLADAAELEFERAGDRQTTSIAFSSLGRRGSQETALVHNVRKPASYSNAKTSEQFAEQAAESEDGGFAEDESETASAESAVETIWNTFGVEAETVDAREYRKDYPNLQAVAIGEFNFAPNGGVRITRVSTSGIFASGEVKLQEGDLIFGFGVGQDKEGQLSVASVDNLYYIAQRVDEFASQDSGKAKAYLIRGNKPYFLEIDLTAK